jgi:hypothetical protein
MRTFVLSVVIGVAMLLSAARAQPAEKTVEQAACDHYVCGKQLAAANNFVAAGGTETAGGTGGTYPQSPSGLPGAPGVVGAAGSGGGGGGGYFGGGGGSLAGGAGASSFASVKATNVVETPNYNASAGSVTVSW